MERKKTLYIIGIILMISIALISAVFIVNNSNTKPENTSYKITFISSGGNEINSQIVEENGKVTKPADPTRSGYIFVEWTHKGTKYNFSTPVTSDLELRAKWKKIEEDPEDETYTVSFDSDGGSTVEAQTVKHGEKVFEPETPIKEGYVFKEWSLGFKTYDFNSEITSNIELKAIWEKAKTYKITFDSTGGSNVQSQTVAEGKKVSKPKSPTKKGYIFESWTLNGKEYDFNNVVTNNITLTATWRDAKQLTVSFDTTGGTTINSQTVIEGTKLTKPENPTKEGYTFEGWTLDGKTFDFNTIITKNITLKATWKAIQKKSYTVSFDTAGGSNVNNQTIIEGNKVIKPENPTRDGYSFVGWTLDGKTFDFDTTITKDITLTATWKEVLTFKYIWGTDIDAAGQSYLYIVDQHGNKHAGTVTVSYIGSDYSETVTVPTSGLLLVKEIVTISNVKAN